MKVRTLEGVVAAASIFVPQRPVLGGVIASMLIVAFPAASVHAQMTVEERHEEIRKLKWSQGGTHELAESHSTISLPAGHFVVMTQDAARFETLIGNNGIAANHLEAVVVTPDDQQVIFQSFNDAGYVALDDWKDVDASAMLDSIRQKTASENEQKIRDGLKPLTVTGWIQEPTLDRQTNTVYWAISLTEGETPMVNAVALRLSRRGFEKLTWVGHSGVYKPTGGELDLALRSHSFDAGSRYADYVEGDKVAAYGIGALVATVIGAKLVKVGALAGLAALAKKAGAFVLVAIAAALARFRRAIFRKKEVANPPDIANPPP